MMDNILEDREKRYYEILARIEKYQMPVVCGKINYPGKDKNTAEAQKAFQILQSLLTEKFGKNSVDTQMFTGDDGSSILMSVDLSLSEAKKMAVHLETVHPLGRIFDIDVYGEEGRSVGRESIGMAGRKCILCDGDARVCMKIGRHSFQDVVDKMNQSIHAYISLEMDEASGRE